MSEAAGVLDRATVLLLWAALACAPGPDFAAPACEMPTARTALPAPEGAVLEIWELALDDVTTDALPDAPAFLEYRAAIERDGADLRRPIADAPEIEDEVMAAVWRNEWYNTDLVYDSAVGAIEPITCLDALLFTRQAERLSPSDHPTEFVASVLRRETDGRTELRAVFGAGSEMFVPREVCGIDVAAELVGEGWGFWYAIHNHTVQTHDGRLALGVPVPSTSDVALLRGLGRDLGLESVRVTNGFYTFRAPVEVLARFRTRE